MQFNLVLALALSTASVIAAHGRSSFSPAFQAAEDVQEPCISLESPWCSREASVVPELVVMACCHANNGVGPSPGLVFLGRANQGDRDVPTGPKVLRTAGMEVSTAPETVHS